MVPGFRFGSRLDLACLPSAPAHARRHACEVLQGWSLTDEVVRDALTIVSELTTNAVRHTGEPNEQESEQQDRPAARMCSLTLWIAWKWLFVAVADQSERLPQLRPISLDAETGRGLQLIAGLTDGNWGFEKSEPAGKVVWAGLAIPVPPMQTSLSPTRCPARPGGIVASPGRLWTYADVIHNRSALTPRDTP